MMNFGLKKNLGTHQKYSSLPIKLTKRDHYDHLCDPVDRIINLLNMVSHWLMSFENEFYLMRNKSEAVLEQPARGYYILNYCL